MIDGTVVWEIELVMLAEQFIGGNIRARLVINKGKYIIRPLIVTMSFIIVGKMLWEQGYFSLIFG